MNTKQVGTQFEREVSQHYETLGYRVTPNVEIGGRQVDILATQRMLGIDIRLLVEAKFRSSPLKAGDAEKFVALAERLTLQGKITSAVLVSNTPITERVRGLCVEHENIHIVTLDELKKDLLNYTSYMLRYKINYEASDIFKEYVPLNGRSSRLAWDRREIVSSLLNWAKTEREPLAILLGDFGSGKSTVIDRIRYEQIVIALSDDQARIPLLFPLGRLLQYEDLWDYVSAGLAQFNNISPPIPHFKSELARGRFLILLDGFDEIYSAASAIERAQFLTRLTPLISSNSPSILSTRPTFFESKDEMFSAFQRSLRGDPKLQRVSARGLNISEVYRRIGLKARPPIESASLNNFIDIREFTKGDVLVFLRNHQTELHDVTGLEPDEVLERLSGIYDLTDLMSRPLLLKMIVSTLLSEGSKLLDPSEPIGPSSIYELYTQSCMYRDYQKEEDNEKDTNLYILNIDERLEVCRQIALKMLSAGRLDLSREDSRRAILNSNLQYLKTHRDAPQEAIERVETEMRVCSFVSEQTGGFRFSHKSYYEFFIAQAIALQWLRRMDSILEFASKKLGKEIVYFLASYARDQPEIKNLLITSIKSRYGEGAGASAFFNRILLAAGNLADYVEIRGGSIQSVDISRHKIVGLSLSDVDMSAITFRSCDLGRLKVESGRMNEVLFKETMIDDGHIEVQASKSMTISGCSLRKTVLQLRGDWELEASSFEQSRILLAGSGWLKKVEFREFCQITIGEKYNCGSAVDSSFENCTIRSEAQDGWYNDGSGLEFRNCQLDGVHFQVRDVVAMQMSDHRKVVLEGCRGIVLAHDPGNFYKVVENRKQSAHSKNPKLIVLETEQLSQQLALFDKHLNLNKDGGTTSNPRFSEIVLARQIIDSLELEPLHPLLKGVPSAKEFREKGISLEVSA